MHHRSLRIASFTVGAAVLIVLGWSAFGHRESLLLRTTGGLVLGTCLLAVPLGSLLALLIVKTNTPGRRTAGVMLGVMLMVPLYLQAGAWLAGFGYGGWASHWLGGAEKLQAAADVLRLGKLHAAIWIQAMAATPWVAAIVGVALLAVEPELEEQALLSGTPAQVFVRVTLRRAATAMAFAAVWVAVTTAGEMTVTDLLLVRTYAEEVYTQYALGEAAASTAWETWSPPLLTALLAGLLVIAAARFTPRMTVGSLRRTWRYEFTACRPLAGLVCWGLVGLIVAVPLGSLAYQAGRVFPGQAETTFGWSAWAGLVNMVKSLAENAEEFGWSTIIAACAATAALLAACAMGSLAQRGRIWAIPVLVVATVALAVPGPTLGVGCIHLLNRPDLPGLVWLYDQSILAPWLVQTVRALPLVMLITWYALRTLGSDTLESAAMEGAGWAARLWHVAIPARWAAMLVAWLAGFVIAMGELDATLLVYPPGMDTLPVRLFGLIHYGVNERVAGISLALVALLAIVGLGFVAAGILLYRRRGEEF